MLFVVCRIENRYTSMLECDFGIDEFEEDGVWSTGCKLSFFNIRNDFQFLC